MHGAWLQKRFSTHTGLLDTGVRSGSESKVMEVWLSGIPVYTYMHHEMLGQNPYEHMYTYQSAV